MREGATNFAHLMDLLEVRTSALSEAIGADKTLVSRWRSGKRKLMPGHHWAGEVAGYLLSVDNRLKHPIIPEVLQAYYPADEMDTREQRQALLTRWLTSAGQKEARYQQERAGLIGLLMDRIESLDKPEPPLAAADPLPQANMVVYGVKGVRGSALQIIDLILAQDEPQEAWYVCPEGLDLYTRDEKFGTQLMDKLMEMFAAGHTLNVVLRTDYKMTDVSAFSGRWLVGHLLGYIHSHYFDEFNQTYGDRMLAVIKNRMAMIVSDGKENDRSSVYTAIHFDKPTVEKVWRECESYRRRSKQRFHYQLFEQPEGFLCGAVPLPDRAHYQFARLPHHVLAGRDGFQQDFGLSGKEMEGMEREFPMLFSTPDFFEPGTPVRHVFCENDIEDALLKNRHMSQELSAITGRKVMMTTQTLVYRLILIKKQLERNRNYEVCFLPDEVFRKLTMQIACWGDRAAIGWIAGGKSTACKDYTNVNALTGFCGAVWERIPGIAKSRRAAIRKINTWMKKAAKYGYSTE